MKIAITGAAGFVGRYLGQTLTEAGHELILLDRKDGWDITDPAIAGRVPACEVIIHLAARSFVPDSYKDPQGFYAANTGGTLNMLEAARLQGARFVYISSYVYGQPQYQPIDEAHPVDPFNPYAQSKILAEDLCRAYGRDFKVPVTILRPFNIYGLGQPDHFLIPKIVRQALAGEEIQLFDPRPKRDFVHVRDIVKAVAAAASRTGEGTETVNIGTGSSHAIPELCAIIGAELGQELSVTYLHQYRPAEILDTVCNSTKAAAVLGWRPEVTLQQGLSEMIRHYATSVS